MHSLGLLCVVPAGSHLPSAQVAHAVCDPLFSYLPSAHTVHVPWFSAEMVPSSHATFTVASPTTGHFHPAGQLPQLRCVPAPSAAQRPALQAAHVVCVSSYFPAAHGVHVDAPVFASVL